jgi:hypothetical protein
MSWYDVTDDGAIRSITLDINDDILEGVCSEILELGHEQGPQDVTTGIMTGYHTSLPCFNHIRNEISKVLPYSHRHINLWGNALQGMQHIFPHSHKSEKEELIPQLKSFCFYPKVFDSMGPIYFQEKKVLIAPKKCQLLLWDCDLLHEVFPNEDEKNIRFSVTGLIKISWQDAQNLR